MWNNKKQILKKSKMKRISNSVEECSNFRVVSNSGPLRFYPSSQIYIKRWLIHWKANLPVIYFVKCRTHTLSNCCGDPLGTPDLVCRLFSTEHIWESTDTERSFLRIFFIWLKAEAYRKWGCHKFLLWGGPTPRRETKNL